MTLADFEILAFQNREFKILAALKILAFQNLELNIFADLKFYLSKLVNLIFWPISRC